MEVASKEDLAGVSVLWANVHGRWYYGGSKVAPVIEDAMHGEFLGTDFFNANAAELSGTCWAMMIALQYNLYKRDIYYGSSFAANSTATL